jgi:ribonucleoside-diphosphate reductase beta chain
VFSAFNEGVNLFSSFAILTNFSRFNKLKGVGQIIGFSIKDESLHSEAGCWLFRTLVAEHKSILEENQLREKIEAAARLTIELEDAFIEKAFSFGPIEGLTVEDMRAFIRHRCNTKLADLGLDPIFVDVDKAALARMAWFDVLSAGVAHTDFFAQRVTDYAKSSIDFSGIWD